jgi:hypothetical protein
MGRANVGAAKTSAGDIIQINPEASLHELATEIVINLESMIPMLNAAAQSTDGEDPHATGLIYGARQLANLALAAAQICDERLELAESAASRAKEG